MGDEEPLFGYPIVMVDLARRLALEVDHKIMTDGGCINGLDNRLVSDLDYWLVEGTRVEWEVEIG